MDAALRVAIVEDQRLFRELLLGLLAAQPGISVVASAGSVTEAAAVIRPGSVDVALLDVDLPDGNGVELGRTLRSASPRMGVVLLSAHDVMDVLLGVPESERAGWSYLSKTTSTSVEVLVRALRLSALGGAVLDPELVERSVPRAGSPLARLRPRQLEAVRLLAEGLSNTAIAERMRLSTHSVDNLLNGAYAELGLEPDPSMNNRVAAALLVARHSSRMP